MPNMAWLGAEEDLSPAALTVRAQQIPLDDQGNLLWPNLFPRVDVDDLEFKSIDTTDFRPTADRREFGARGRLIPVRTPGTRQFEWVPIESYFHLGEKEIGKLLAQFRGNIGLFRDEIRVRIPDRTDVLVTSNLRRIEVDAFNAWILGSITQKNAQTGETQTVALGLDAARYETAAAAWSAAADAYSLFLAFLERAIAAVGRIRGAAMRLAQFKIIQADAPPLVPGSTVLLNRVQLEDAIAQQIGMPFRFYIIENTVDIFNDAGTDVTNTPIFPANRIAVIPADGTIGETLFAPVTRAYDIQEVQPKAGIDVRGMTVYHEAENLGRDLTIECQVNAFSNPIERKVFVVNTLG